MSRLFENPTIAGIASIASSLSGMACANAFHQFMQQNVDLPSIDTRPTARKLTRKVTEAVAGGSIADIAALRRAKAQYAGTSEDVTYASSFGQRSMFLASQANIPEGTYAVGHALVVSHTGCAHKWHPHRPQPGSNQASNICFAVRIKSGFNVDAARVACQGLFDANETLRTLFAVGDGKAAAVHVGTALCHHSHGIVNAHADGTLWAKVVSNVPAQFDVVDATDWSKERCGDECNFSLLLSRS